MKNKKYKEDKLFEYRVRYNASESHVAQDNYHYFMARNSNEALEAHKSMLLKHKLCVQDISIEKYNPYSEKWEDETEFKREKPNGKC